MPPPSVSAAAMNGAWPSRNVSRPSPNGYSRSRAGAPGPSGGRPRISVSWKSFSGSSMSARNSDERSPKRRYSVPLPTPASAATSSIDTQSRPRCSISRAAAHRMLSRLRRASERSRLATGGAGIGSSIGWGTTWSTVCGLRFLYTRPSGQDAHQLGERVAQLGLGQPAVAVERRGRLADRQLAVEDVRADHAEDLADLRLGPDRAEQAGRGADDGDGPALQRVVGERARRPVQRVLQHAGDGAVVLGGRDEDAVGVLDRLAQPGDRLGRGLDVDVAVVVGQVPQAVVD